MALTDVNNQLDNLDLGAKTDIIGFDIGFGWIKASYKTDSSSQNNFAFPSVISTQISSFGQENSISNFDELLDSLAITYNGVTYLIGNKALLEARNARLSLRQDRNDLATRIKIMTTLALLTKPESYETKFDLVVSGLPMLEFKGSKESYQKLLTSAPFEFIFHIGDKSYPKKITIKNAKILAQSEASFYDYILDSSGNIISSREKDISDNIITVIDLGMKTTDICSTKSGRIIDALSSQLNLGMITIQKEVNALLMNEFGIKRELIHMDELIKNKQIVYNTKTYDLTEIINKAMIPFCEAVIDELYSITNGDPGAEIQLILLTGGTSIITYPYIKKQLENIVNVVPMYNSSFSNSNGYLKFGTLLKNNNVI